MNHEDLEALEARLVEIEWTDPTMLKYHPPREWMGKDKALAIEMAGKGRIVTAKGPAQTYETRMMVPKRPDGLTMEDLYGPKQTYETKKIKKKIVAWVMDRSRTGGAELSCDEVVRVGNDCGFKIQMITPETGLGLTKSLLEGCDFAVINNFFEFAEQPMRVIQDVIYNGKPYVKYEHDHRELKRKEFSRPLFERSKLNVFLSPMHLQHYKNGLGVDGICLPLAINTERYRPVGVQRQQSAAVVSNIRNFKSWTGLRKFIREHPDWSFTVMGDRSSIAGPNVRILGLVPADQMPAVYSAHEYCVHILDGWGAGERVVFEAALCGCRVIANNHVGHMSWGRDLNDVDGLRAWLRQTPYDFWCEVAGKTQ